MFPRTRPGVSSFKENGASATSAPRIQSEDLRHGGAVRPGGAVRVRRVGALAEESRKSSSRFDVGKLFVEVVDEFFNIEVVDEVFVFAAIRLLLRGCRAPPHSSRLQGSRSQSLYIYLNETFPLSSCS